MRDQIIERPQKIELENKVVILYACGSGSRAWGFPSADSDYDIRFIYAHPRDWYLTIQDSPAPFEVLDEILRRTLQEVNIS